MLQKAIDAVAEFHVAKNVDFKQRLDLDHQLVPTERHHLIVHQMKDASQTALKQFLSFQSSPEKITDLRLLRIHLILEEVAELVKAIDACDEVEVLDGMADAIYVINGTAVCFDLPLAAAYVEVHRSNMSKALSKSADNPRLQDKGQEYIPPRLSELLKAYRTGGMEEVKNALQMGAK